MTNRFKPTLRSLFLIVVTLIAVTAVKAGEKSINNRIKQLEQQYQTLSSSFLGNKMNVLQDQPLFKLMINTFGTKHIISINGIAIITDMDKNGQSESTYPINHLMRSGTNSFEVYIFPEKTGEKINKHSKVEISLIVTNNKDLNETYIISDVKFRGTSLEGNSSFEESSESGTFNSDNKFAKDEKGDVTVHKIIKNDTNDYPGGIKLSRKIEIESSLPLWNFFKSHDLPDYDSMNDEEYYRELDTLLKEYLKIIKAIETKKIDSIIDMFSERNNEMDLAFYQPSGTYREKLKSSLTDAANDNGLEIVELEKSHVNFTVEDNRKLTSLTRNNFKAAISLNFKKGVGSQRYPISFRLENKKWIISR